MIDSLIYYIQIQNGTLGKYLIFDIFFLPRQVEIIFDFN